MGARAIDGTACIEGATTAGAITEGLDGRS
jgi:hypothetical protein